MNQSTPQQQNAAAEQAWPSFLDGPAPAPYAQHATAPVTHQQAPQPFMHAQGQQQPAIQPWGLAAPQIAPQPAQHANQMYFSQAPAQHGYAQAPVMPQQSVATYPHPQQPYVQQAPMQGQAPAAAPAYPGANSFAYPAADGMQVVQAPADGGIAVAAAAVPATPLAAGAVAADGAKPRRRGLRWEVLVPAGTAVVLLVTAVVVFTNWDRITGGAAASDASAGRSSNASSQTADGAGTSDSSADASTPDVASNDTVVPAALPEAQTPKLNASEGKDAVAKAKQLIKLGRYQEAAGLLQPLIKPDAAPAPAVAALMQQITLGMQKGDALDTQLGTQRAAGNWAGVLKTLTLIERQHPLNPAQLQLRAQAQAQLGGGAKSPAKAPAAHGVAHVPTVAKKPATAPATPGARVTGGGGASSATPPTSGAPAGGAPARPTVANPSTPPTNTAGIMAQPVGDAAMQPGMGAMHDGM